MDLLGVQSHIGPGTNPESQGPNTFNAADQAAWKQFLDAAVAMGLRLALTEFDVSERGTPSDIPERDRQIADLARRYLDFMFAYRRPGLSDGLGHDGSLFLAAEFRRQATGRHAQAADAL